MMATGAILLATTNFLPQLVQEDFGYTATWAGLVLSPGGRVTVVAMFAVGQLSRKVQPRYLIATGAGICAASMYWLTSLTPDAGFWFFAETRMVIGARPAADLHPDHGRVLRRAASRTRPTWLRRCSTRRATPAARSASRIASNVLANREQFHQSRLVEPPDRRRRSTYQQGLQQVTHYFTQHGRLGEHGAAARRSAGSGQQVQQQSSLLAYIDVFWVLMLMSLVRDPAGAAVAQGQARRRGAGGALNQRQPRVHRADDGGGEREARRDEQAEARRGVARRELEQRRHRGGAQRLAEQPRRRLHPARRAAARLGRGEQQQPVVGGLEDAEPQPRRRQRAENRRDAEARRRQPPPPRAQRQQERAERAQPRAPTRAASRPEKDAMAMIASGHAVM